MKAEKVAEFLVAAIGGSASWLVPLRVPEATEMLLLIVTFAAALWGAIVYMRRRERGLPGIPESTPRQRAWSGAVFAVSLVAYWLIWSHTVEDTWGRVYALTVPAAVICALLAFGMSLYSNALVNAARGK